MLTSNDAVERFRKNLSRVRGQYPINERDFLRLAKDALNLAKVRPPDRETIANRMALLWFEHSKELSDHSKYIGSLFADLEIPDIHAEYRSNKNSTRELWEELETAVTDGIHIFETRQEKPVESKLTRATIRDTMSNDSLEEFYKRAEQLYAENPVKIKDYLLLFRRGIDLAKKYPESREHIGETMVSVGAGTLLISILESAPDLEHPSLTKDWGRMEGWVDGAIEELSEVMS